MGTTDLHEFPIQSSNKGELTRVQRRIPLPEVCKPEVPVPIAPAPTVQFVTAPAPDPAPTSSISAPAEPHLPYSTKHYRKLEAEQAGKFRNSTTSSCHTAAAISVSRTGTLEDINSITDIGGVPLSPRKLMRSGYMPLR
ncbi:hypothetical protein DPMN_047947 [Dreissena polymorpha]|uniref:Uncharacterized protein n=1 Tax=Dreissena polymorpha TaxID=45954 RepID=A0A9D4D8M8_DREPO|nr:hypothetical protein DPMN_047947 [Dreissena polymorpha]